MAGLPSFGRGAVGQMAKVRRRNPARHPCHRQAAFLVGRTREFRRVISSRTKPSQSDAAFSDGVTLSDGAAEIGSGPASSLSDSGLKTRAIGASAGLSRTGCATGDGGSSPTPGEVFSASLPDFLRLPLRNDSTQVFAGLIRGPTGIRSFLRHGVLVDPIQKFADLFAPQVLDGDSSGL